MINIKLRPLVIEDLDSYYECNKPTKLFHQFNGPYYEKKTEEELKEKVEKMRAHLKTGAAAPASRKAIVDESNDALIGEVSRYWKSKETNWMEIGIVIYNENYWGKSIGYKALKQWINYIFKENLDIVRLGLTTWSGNERMMKLSEKLGFKLEACYRNARIVDGKYYDSVSYGILKEEWISDAQYLS